MDAPDKPATRAEELKAFVFFAVLLAPLLSVMAVGGYGFFVWMVQLFTGRLPAA